MTQKYQLFSLLTIDQYTGVNILRLYISMFDSEACDDK